MEEPRIALAASPREWARALHRHVADHGGALVRATVLHEQDAIAEDYDLFVADDSTSFLTRRLVDELHRRGRSVLGVFDPDDPRGKGELVDLGVDDVIARDAGPEAFVAALVALQARNRRPVDTELDALVRGLDVSRTTDASLAEQLPPPPPRTSAPLEPGRITAVGAAGGGAGGTEVAIGLALAAGARGDSTVLVDADEVAPSLAQRLALPLYPNIRAAVDALEHRTRGLAEVLAPMSGGRFSVLPGLSNPRSWSELHPGPTVGVLRELTTLRANVIANVGSRLEDLRAAGGPGRYGLSRAVLGATDTVVAVAHPTPVGMARLLEWLGDVRVLAPTSDVHVLFNRAPPSAFKQRELAEELARSVSPAGLWFLPSDPRVEAAAWSGSLPASGPFTKAVTAAAAAILPTRTAVPRHRRRRVRA